MAPKKSGRGAHLEKFNQVHPRYMDDGNDDGSDDDYREPQEPAPGSGESSSGDESIGEAEVGGRAPAADPLTEKKRREGRERQRRYREAPTPSARRAGSIASFFRAAPLPPRGRTRSSSSPRSSSPRSTRKRTLPTIDAAASGFWRHSPTLPARCRHLSAS